MQVIDLNGEWHVRADGRAGTMPVQARAARRWMKAAVPGTVHTDLMASGVIPDPFYRMNENTVQWVDGVRWLYRRDFSVKRGFLAESHVKLVAEGLDTCAEIRLNGRRVGKESNMFTACEYDIKAFLRPGRNTIAILFDSPVARAKALERKHGHLQVALESHRVHIRKAQYAFGWDWGPRLTTSGIWRPIRLEAYSGARLRDPRVRVVSVRSRSASLLISARVEDPCRTRCALRLRIEGEGAHHVSLWPVRGSAVEVRVTLKDPRLWWPNGYGRQPLYTAILTLLENEREVDAVRAPFAVRTVRLRQEADSEGRSFIFEVNGTKVFAKGADWIPADTFLPRVTAAVYERLLTLAREASMNMIRVWGGGIYEDEAFYDLCDRLGLMVWQDFMYACGEYPDHHAFLAEARREAEQVVTRLRNHPSIVLWCGNNECEWIYCTRNPGRTPDQMRGAKIFRTVLPRVVHRLDGTRPYWRSTPFGRGFPNAESEGNHHQWDVWSGWKDFREYEQNKARFVSEFGFQGPANRLTMESVLERGDRSPQSPGMEHHDKQVEGTERLFRYLAGHFTVAEGWEEFLYRGQLLQAEALKCATEHWRRRKFRTAGVLVWQLNDCWPVTSWSVIDSGLRPKAAYYYAKRFFAPLLVSFASAGSRLEVWATNDTLAPIRGRLIVEFASFTGKTHWRKELPVRIPGNASRLLHVFPRAVVQDASPRASYLRAELRRGRRPIAANRLFLVEPKHLLLPVPTVDLGVRRVGHGMAELTLRSSVLAVGVRLSSRDEQVVFADNYVTLDPNVPTRIDCTGPKTIAELRRSVTIHTYVP